jgi:rhodanese-related sulfurtransferase
MRPFVFLALIAALLIVTASATRFQSQLHSQKEAYWGAFGLNDGYKNMTAAQLFEFYETVPYNIIDVREPDEYKAGHIPGAVNFPLSTLDYTYKNLPTGTTIYIHCLGGVRSIKAINLLLTKPVKLDMVNIQDGFNGWVNGGYPVIVNAIKAESTNFNAYVESLYAIGIAQRPETAKKIENVQSASKSGKFEAYLEALRATGIGAEEKKEQLVGDVSMDAYVGLFEQKQPQVQKKEQTAPTTTKLTPSFSAYIEALKTMGF